MKNEQTATQTATQTAPKPSEQKSYNARVEELRAECERREAEYQKTLAIWQLCHEGNK